MNSNPYNLSPVLLKRFEQFKKINDNNKKFERIIELGKKLAPFDPKLKIETNQVKGCASLTYISGFCEDGLMQYQGESSSHLVKGLLALLIEGFSGLKPEEVLSVDPKFIEDMGLAQALTASRANGFMNTYMMMIDIARRYE
jgi:cysteine desulfuration protein SufE